MDKIFKHGLLIVKDNKFLINRKFGTNLFLMPGGKPEEGESVEDCLVREIMEEHGCEVVVDSIKFFGEFEDMATNEPNTIISMKVYTGDIKGEPKTNSEIEEQRWFSNQDDKDILSSLLRDKLLPEIVDRGLIK